MQLLVVEFNRFGWRVDGTGFVADWDLLRQTQSSAQGNGVSVGAEHAVAPKFHWDVF